MNQDSSIENEIAPPEVQALYEKIELNTRQNHGYDVYTAVVLGYPDVLIFGYIAYWIKANAASRRNFHDGEYWTYNSVESISKQYPELTNRQVYNALHRLQSLRLIKRGNYNKLAYDRTSWYALTDLGKSFLLDTTDYVYDKKTKQIVKSVTDEDTQSNTHFTNSRMTNYTRAEPIPVVEPVVDPVVALSCSKEHEASSEKRSNETRKTHPTNKPKTPSKTPFIHPETCFLDGANKALNENIAENDSTKAKEISKTPLNAYSDSTNVNATKIAGFWTKEVNGKLRVVDENGNICGGHPYSERAYQLWEEIIGTPLKRNRWNTMAGYNMMRAKDKGEQWLIGMLKLSVECQKDKKADFRTRISNLSDLQKNWEYLLNWYHVKKKQTQPKEELLYF